MTNPLDIQFRPEDVVRKLSRAYTLTGKSKEEFIIDIFHSMCSPFVGLRNNTSLFFLTPVNTDKLKDLLCDLPSQIEYGNDLMQLLRTYKDITDDIFGALEEDKLPDQSNPALERLAKRFYQNVSAIAERLPVTENLMNRGPVKDNQRDLLNLSDFCGANQIYVLNRMFSPTFKVERYSLYDDLSSLIADSHLLFPGDIGLEKGDVCHIETIVDYLGNAVMPLVTNAVEHAFNPDNDINRRMADHKLYKRIKVSCLPESNTDKGYFKVIVSDNGFGIREDILPHLFEKGVTSKADTTTGHGIGLYAVKQFVEKYGGSISAESEPGMPTRFSFTVPYSNRKSLTSRNEWYDFLYLQEINKEA